MCRKTTVKTSYPEQSKSSIFRNRSQNNGSDTAQKRSFPPIERASVVKDIERCSRYFCQHEGNSQDGNSIKNLPLYASDRVNCSDENGLFYRRKFEVLDSHDEIDFSEDDADREDDASRNENIHEENVDSSPSQPFASLEDDMDRKFTFEETCDALGTPSFILIPVGHVACGSNAETNTDIGNMIANDRMNNHNITRASKRCVHQKKLVHSFYLTLRQSHCSSTIQHAHARSKFDSPTESSAAQTHKDQIRTTMSHLFLPQL